MQLDYVTFSDPDFVHGTITVRVQPMESDFASVSQTWLEYAEAALTSYEVKKNSGDGYEEIYGLHENGSYQYDLLL